jgi:DNA repair protein RecO (recombination protein O)
MGLVKTRAVVLKSQRWGEADRIVTFYTEILGKIGGIARGARRLKSRLGGALEPFGFIDLTVFEKSPDTLVRISQVDVIKSFGKIREDLTVMTAAARMVNMIRAITPDRDPHATVFNTLVGGLQALEDQGDPELCSLLFQIHVLGQTGFRPQTDHCAGCNSLRVLGDWFVVLAVKNFSIAVSRSHREAWPSFSRHDAFPFQR